MQELKTFGETVGKFIIQVEYEDGKKEEKNIINAFENRLRVKKHYNNHKDKIKEYRQNNSEKIKEYNKEYYLKKKEKAILKKQEKEVREFLNELRNQKY